MTDMELFKQYARNASYHYADDSGAEWDQARANVELCRKLYAANPALREEMRAIVANELWSVSELTKGIDKCHA